MTDARHPMVPWLIRLTFAVLVLILAAATPAVADNDDDDDDDDDNSSCSLSLAGVNDVFVSGPNGVGYDVTTTTIDAERATFQVRHRGRACSFFVTFQSDNARGGVARLGNGQGSFLSYRLQDRFSGGNTLGPNGEIEPNRIIAGSFSGRRGRDDDDDDDDDDGGRGTVVDLDYFVAIAPEQFVPATGPGGSGSYEDWVRIRLYRGTVSDNVEVADRRVRIFTHVAPSVRVRLADVGGSFETGTRHYYMDFGQLVSGERQSLDMLISSNLPYNVSMTSTNGGVLAHDDYPQLGEIGYRVDLAGRTFSLGAAGLEVLRRNRPSQAIADRHLLTVEIGDVSGALAGTYRDSVVITVQAM